LVVGPTRSWQLATPCLVNAPNPFSGSKKAMAVGVSLTNPGLFVEEVECDVVVDVG
jgi:hypothetical protein